MVSHNATTNAILKTLSLRCCGVVRCALWRCVNHFNPYFPTLLVMQPLPQWLPDTELSISRVKNSLNPQPYATACCGTILAGEIPGMVLASRK